MTWKVSHLIYFSLALLLLPLILFFIFWFHIVFSILFIFFLIFILKDLLSRIKFYHSEPLYISKKMFLTSSLMILSWIVYSGIGKIGYQNFDYTKHNAIFHDLLNSSWPVQAQIENSTYYLVYYLGYYLTPSGLGKIFNSITVLEYTSIFQSYIILMLILLLLSHATKVKNLLLLAFSLIIWAGLDLLGNFIFYQEYSHQFGEFPEWWAGASNFQYTGFTDLLFWVPQHALGGWLSTILCYYFFQKKNYALIPFVASLTLFWSPFACFGLISFLVVSFFSIEGWKEKIEWMTNRYGLWGLFILIVLLSYFSTSDFKQPFQWQATKMGPFNFTLRYVVFLLLEIGAPLCLIVSFRKLIPKELHPLFYITALILVLIPHIYFGVYSDFAMRASITGLFTLFIFTIYITKQLWNKSLYKYVFTIYFALISYSALSDVYRAQKLKHIVLGYGPTQSFAPKDISFQYFGRKSNNFFSLFFKN